MIFATVVRLNLSVPILAMVTESASFGSRCVFENFPNCQAHECSMSSIRIMSFAPFFAIPCQEGLYRKPKYRAILFEIF